MEPILESSTSQVKKKMHFYLSTLAPWNYASHGWAWWSGCMFVHFIRKHVPSQGPNFSPFCIISSTIHLNIHSSSYYIPSSTPSYQNKLGIVWPSIKSFTFCLQIKKRDCNYFDLHAKSYNTWKLLSKCTVWEQPNT